MSSAVSTPPPKGKARQQNSRSTAHSTQSDGAASPRSAQRKQKHNRHIPEHHKPALQPAWEGADTSQPAEGFFDSNGRYVAPDALNETDGGRGSDNVGSLARPKKNRKQQAQNHDADMRILPTTERSSPPKGPRTASQNYQSQPQTQATPAKSTAYAGPTFHASPAPSALPVPKFFSKSVPAASSETSLQARLEQDSDKSESPPTQAAAPAPEPPKREESPLDFFFKADREEKAKRRSASGLSTPEAKPPPRLSSFQSEPAPANNWNVIYGADQRRHSRHPSTGSGKEMFMLELDSNGGAGRYSPQGSSSPAHPTGRAPNGGYFSPGAGVNGFNPPVSFPKNASPLPSPPVSGHSSDEPTQLSPFYSPNRTPQNAPQSPIASRSGNTSQDFHYGNRNLSPLFKAAQNDSFRRSSSLRQEVSASSPTASGKVELPASNHFSSPTRNGNGQVRSPKDHFSSQLEAAAVSMPNLRLQKVDSLSPSVAPATPPRAELDATPRGPTALSPASSAPPGVKPAPLPSHQPLLPRSNSLDVKSMEDNLKRMLNMTIAADVR